MADSPLKPTTNDDMHWVLYLREDIQEIRQDLRALSVRVDGIERRLSERIDDTNRRIDSRFGLLLMTMIALFGMTIGFMEYRLPPL